MVPGSIQSLNSIDFGIEKSGLAASLTSDRFDTHKTNGTAVLFTFLIQGTRYKECSIYL
jgi:hypothetical protein